MILEKYKNLNQELLTKDKELINVRLEFDDLSQEFAKLDNYTSKLLTELNKFNFKISNSGEIIDNNFIKEKN